MWAHVHIFENSQLEGSYVWDLLYFKKRSIIYYDKLFNLTLRQICQQFKFICLTDTAIFVDLRSERAEKWPNHGGSVCQLFAYP